MTPICINNQAQRVLEQLTARERQVLGLLVQGVSLSEIAQRLNLCLSTASTHKRHIYLKLRVRSDSHLVLLAMAAGLAR